MENGDGKQAHISSPAEMDVNSLWLVNETDSVTLGLRGTLKAEICFKSVGALSSISWYDSACAPTPEPTLSPTSLSSLERRSGSPASDGATQAMSTTGATVAVYPGLLGGGFGSQVERHALDGSWGGSDLPGARHWKKPSASGECPLTTCDFSKLRVGVFSTDVEQNDKLLNTCQLSITGNMADGTGNLAVNVFNSSSPTAGQWPMLGSPHASCGGDPRVVGAGGSAQGFFPNCKSQDNVLVVQRPGEPEEVPTSSDAGGCIFISFVDPVDLSSLAVMSTDPGEPIVINVSDELCHGLMGCCVFFSPFCMSLDSTFCRWRMAMGSRPTSAALQRWM